MSLLDDKLETFVAVCETKNFTKAGEVLGLTQPAVSHHIKKLEEELNAPLFLRKKGELVLSEEGEIALLYAKRIRAICEKMQDKIKNAKTNIYKIRIGITHTQESGLMIEALSRIALNDDNLTITFITDTIKNLYAMLENFEIDMAIIEEKPTNPDFRFTIIDTDMLVCIVSPQNPVSQKASISLQELKKQHLILRISRNIMYSIDFSNTALIDQATAKAGSLPRLFSRLKDQIDTPARSDPLQFQCKSDQYRAMTIMPAKMSGAAVLTDDRIIICPKCNGIRCILPLIIRVKPRAAVHDLKAGVTAKKVHKQLFRFHFFHRRLRNIVKRSPEFFDPINICNHDACRRSSLFIITQPALTDPIPQWTSSLQNGRPHAFLIFAIALSQYLSVP